MKNTILPKSILVAAKKNNTPNNTPNNNTEPLDRVTSITCAICGKVLRMLSNHLSTHNTTLAEYKEKYPNAETLIPRTEEYKQKMRDKWEEKRATWSAGIRAKAQLPEQREKQRTQTKARIARDGYHLAWGKESNLEAFVATFLESHLGLKIEKQYKTTVKINNANRFFDIYVPAINLLVECDGEYWHCAQDRIENDIAKTDYARAHGYNFLRISDKYISRSTYDNQSPPAVKEAYDYLLTLLEKTPEELFEYSYALIAARRFTQLAIRSS